MICWTIGLLFSILSGKIGSGTTTIGVEIGEIGCGATTMSVGVGEIGSGATTNDLMTGSGLSTFC